MNKKNACVVLYVLVVILEYFMKCIQNMMHACMYTLVHVCVMCLYVCVSVMKHTNS